MDLAFIAANANKEVHLPRELIDKLPEHVCVAVAAQFLSQLASVKKTLEAAGKTVSYVEGKHARFPGQILGCSWAELHFPDNTQAFLYVGDGKFHPKALLLGSTVPVYQYDPFADSIELLDPEIVADIKRHAKAALVKFLHATHVGIILSTKPGQQQLHLALDLKKNFPDKKFYYLTFNTVEFNQLENFPFVEVYVNTSCNRIIDDYKKFPRPVAEIDDLLALGSDSK